MIDRKLERRGLQAAIAVAVTIPLSAGYLGVAQTSAFLGLEEATTDFRSHFAYLSGVLLAIGLLFAATIPAIERQGERFRLLTLIVFIGGLARLYILIRAGIPSPGHLLGLLMELVVTPALCLWQYRLARRYRDG